MSALGVDIRTKWYVYYVVDMAEQAMSETVAELVDELNDVAARAPAHTDLPDLPRSLDDYLADSDDPERVREVATEIESQTRDERIGIADESDLTPAEADVTVLVDAGLRHDAVAITLFAGRFESRSITRSSVSSVVATVREKRETAQRTVEVVPPI
jgi:hypothetical protein